MMPGMKSWFLPLGILGMFFGAMTIANATAFPMMIIGSVLMIIGVVCAITHVVIRQMSKT